MVLLLPYFEVGQDELVLVHNQIETYLVGAVTEATASASAEQEAEQLVIAVMHLD